MDAPSLDGEFHRLATEFEDVLTAQGLYRTEAKAMVETWRDSWFAEEGRRIFHIVPRSLIDDVLPLKIDPDPAELARVFVGRVELITSATMKDVDDALAQANVGRAVKYGRFLPSIVERLRPGGSDRTKRREADRTVQLTYASTSSNTRPCGAAGTE